MATLTKTADIEVLAHQAVTHPATVKGSAQDVSTKFSATIICFHSSIEAVANTNPGTFYIQVSGSATNNEDWSTVVKFTVGDGTADTEAMTATEAIGETVLAVAATAGFVATDVLYIQDTGTLADSEFAQCKQIVTDTSIDLVDGLINAKDSSDIIWNDAEIFTAQIDLTAVTRARVIFMHEGAAGANVHVKVLMVTGDSIA